MSVGRIRSVAASGGATGAGSGALVERCVVHEAAVAAHGRERCRSSTCSVQERCSSVAWAQQQQLQRPCALQKRCVAPEAAVTASGSVAGAL